MLKRDPILAAFGQNVRKRREAKQLTQEALAEKADLDRTYISDIERGARKMRINRWCNCGNAQARMMSLREAVHPRESPARFTLRRNDKPGLPATRHHAQLDSSALN
jgi:DNA-binding XRE family transcriptional regulator